MASSSISMDPLNHSLAPYQPTLPSEKPPPYPHAFGAFRSARRTPNPTRASKFDRKPNHSRYYLTFSTYYQQHLHPSPHLHTTTPLPRYEIHHKATPNQTHNIAIVRENIAKSGGVAVIKYLPHHPATLITYPKTGTTQDLLCDASRFGDDSAGEFIHLRDYLVYIGHECCVWQPLGPPRASRDGTIVGMMELRNVCDGNLAAVLGSERSEESREPDTKRLLMVRGEWAPGSEPFEQVIASLIAMMGRECDRIELLKRGCGAVLP